MISVTLWWLFLIPLVLSVASVIIVPKISGGEIGWQQSAIMAVIGLLISAGIMTAGAYIGKGVKTADTEVWNGQITDKSRVHGSYVESYQCNCRTVTSGYGKNQTSSTVCDTCYRDHYTVTWSAASTIGGYTIDHLDWLSRSVYNQPDPVFYSRIVIGEPCSRTHDYTNYIKAVPESLFRPSSPQLSAQFASMIPKYPLGIYSYWHVDRVLPVKVQVSDLGQWNAKLAEALKTLGPAKQANALIVLVNTADPNYEYALRDAWINGKKNDIVLIIGATNFPNKADFVRVLALTDSEMFKIKLRDDIAALDTLTADNVISILAKDTSELFKRKRMRDFAYLDAEIDPPTWITVTTIMLVILAYLACWYFSSTYCEQFLRRRY